MKVGLILVIAMALSGCMRFQEVDRKSVSAVYSPDARSYPPDVNIKRTYLRKKPREVDVDVFRSTTITHAKPEPVIMYELRGRELEEATEGERKGVIEFERRDSSYDRLY